MMSACREDERYEEGRSYWDMRNAGDDVIRRLSERESEACSGGGKYYNLAAGTSAREFREPA